MQRRTLGAGALALSAALALAACSGDSGSGGDAGGAGGSGDGELTGRGPITYVQGKDTSGSVQEQLDRWNKDHPDEKVTLIELPDSADAQRQQMIQNAQTKSDAYTVLSTDVVWTSEFAANQWISPIPEDGLPLDKMLPPVVETAKYRGKLYAVPATSDGGMLYYRKDLLQAANIAEPPKTWAEMTDACKKIQATPQGKGVECFVGQFEKYEGLTVNAAEAINGAGGVITDDEGKPNVNTAEAKAGLQFLADGFKQGYIPKAGITYQEEQGRQAFQAGKLIFHRQWPYQYNLASKNDGSSKVVGKFAVAPLPGKDGPGVSSLGGHNLAISAFAKNKATALDFIKFFSNEENARQNLLINSNAPVYTEMYSDEELVKKFPYLPILKQSIETAKPRPRVVKYGEVTSAIQEAAYSAISGATPVDAALSDLQSKLEKLTQQ